MAGCQREIKATCLCRCFYSRCSAVISACEIIFAVCSMGKMDGRRRGYCKGWTAEEKTASCEAGKRIQTLRRRALMRSRHNHRSGCGPTLPSVRTYRPHPGSASSKNRCKKGGEYGTNNRVEHNFSTTESERSLIVPALTRLGSCKQRHEESATAKTTAGCLTRLPV